MLMNVVLPAPFVPMSPTTESASIAALTSFAAVTAPKRFWRFRASRITATSGGHAVAVALPEQGPQAFGQENDHQQEGCPEEHLPGVRRQVEPDRVQGAEN